MRKSMDDALQQLRLRDQSSRQHREHARTPLRDITSAKEVMFSPTSFCLSVNMITQNYWSNLYEILRNSWTESSGPID